MRRTLLVLVAVLLTVLSACDSKEIAAGHGGTNDDAGGETHASDECVTRVSCVDDSDCDKGHHCNTAMQPPVCQLLYCGSEGSPCDEDELCNDNSECLDNICTCIPECESIMCGPDPKCGVNCGLCDDDNVCTDNLCVDGTCTYEPTEEACGNRECGPSLTCEISCGSCPDDPSGPEFRCADGRCEELPNDYTLRSDDHCNTEIFYDIDCQDVEAAQLSLRCGKSECSNGDIDGICGSMEPCGEIWTLIIRGESVVAAKPCPLDPDCIPDLDDSYPPLPCITDQNCDTWCPIEDGVPLDPDCDPSEPTTAQYCLGRQRAAECE